MPCTNAFKQIRKRSKTTNDSILSLKLAFLFYFMCPSSILVHSKNLGVQIYLHLNELLVGVTIEATSAEHF